MSKIAGGLLVAILLSACNPKAPPSAAPGSRPAEESGARATSSRDELFHLRNLGQLHFERDTAAGYVEAAKAFEQAAKLSKNDRLDELNHARALLFADAESYPKVAEPLARAAKLRGDESPTAAFLYLTGLFHARLGQSEQAVSALVRTIERLSELDASQRFPQVWYQCGRAQEDAAQLTAAEKTYLALIEQWPSFRPAHYRLSRVLVGLKRVDEAKAVMKTFRALPEDKQLDEVQCELTEVSRRPLERAGQEPPEVALSWEDVTPGWRGILEGSEPFRSIAPVDLERDGQLEVLFVGNDSLRLVSTAPVPTTPLSPETLIAATVSGTRDVVAGDLDNDGRPELLLLGESTVLLRWAPDKKQPHYTPAASTLPKLDSVRLFDADHDGDLDLLGIAGQNLVRLRNNGDEAMTFSALGNLEPAADLPPGATVGVHDLDQANDLDLVLPRRSGGATAYLNRRDGTYTPVPLDDFGAHPLVFASDLDNDGAPDIFATGGAGGWSYARNADRAGRPYELRLRPTQRGDASQTGAITDAKLADLDNDGDLDGVLATENGIRFLRNREGRLELEPGPSLGADQPRSIQVADVTYDGRLDLLVVTTKGSLRVLANASKAYARVMLIPNGRRDNEDSVGAVVEVYCGRKYQSLLVREQRGLHVGTGVRDLTHFDGVDVRWPQGIQQAITRPDLELNEDNQSFFEQLEGLVSSCPFLYGKGPDGWKFLTDVIGMAPLDEWLPPGQKASLDPQEWVRVPGSALAVENGRITLALTEELRETAYVDQIEAFVVDHPHDLEIFANESTQQGEGSALITYGIRSQDLAPLASVKDEAGQEQGAIVNKRDRKYLHTYRETKTQWWGWVEPYSLEMITADEASALLLSGRIAWFDSTVVYSLTQHDKGWAPPRLERIHDDGRVELLVSDVGLPAGMDRTIVCRFAPVPAGARLRLTTQHRFLWDQLLTASSLEELTINRRHGKIELSGRTSQTGSAPETIKYTAARLSRARLSDRGYSRTTGDRGRHEQTYDYSSPLPQGVFGRAIGRATHYGNVDDLLRRPDDQLAVLVAGDTMEFSFQVDAPSRGRTYFLRVIGWAKEDGYHVSTGTHIGPLPFHAMTKYPPPAEETPTEDDYLQYLENYQTRKVNR